MSIQSLSDIVRERISEGTRAANGLADCIRPIYGVDDSARPFHIASAILLDLAEGPYILTAAHVIDWADDTTLYLGIGVAIELDGTFSVSLAPNGDRDLDVIDVAISPFPREHLGSLGTTTFYPEHQIGDWRGPCAARSYTCIGFPNSQNRTPPRSLPNIMKPRTRTYTSKGISAARLPNRAYEEAHILIDYNSKFSRTMDGRRTNSGKPEGMSGGAVFDLGNLMDPATLADPIAPKLAGLFIEAHRNAGVIVATRIAPVLRHFRRNGGLIADALGPNHETSVL